jgi:hypothetical protein
MSIQFKVCIALACIGAMCQGCTTTLVERSSFDKLRQRQGMGHFFYIGSKGHYHYFASSYFMEPTRFYRYPRANLSLQNEFAKTHNREKWVRFVVDWADKTQYFIGEPPEPLVLPVNK